MKYTFYIFIILLCSCQQELPPRTVGICRQLKEARENDTRMDSLVNLSKEFTDDERYMVLCTAVSSTSGIHQIKKYSQQLSTIPYPKTIHKDMGFILLYYFSWGEFKTSPEIIDQISSLFFEMENRQHLTIEEKCLLLVNKSFIYSFRFQEYEPALQYAIEAESLAYKAGLTGKTVDMINSAQWRAYMIMDSIPRCIETDLRFLEIADKKQWITQEMYNTIYHRLRANYLRQQNYKEALRWHLKAKSSNSFYSFKTTEIFLGLDSISQALSHLEESRKHTKTPFESAKITWDEARIRQRMGDSAAYEINLKKTIQQYDLVFASFRQYTPDLGNPIKAYSQLLWQKGKHNEAIVQMEKIVNLILNNKTSFTYPETQPYTYRKKEEQLNKLDLLRDYYQKTGRYADALRLSQQSDTLRQIYAATRLKVEENKVAAKTYIASLERNLEFRIANFSAQRRKLYFMYASLCLVIGSIVVSGLLYQRRKKKLNALYAKQKEIEYLEQATPESRIPDLHDFPADEQLFRQLEKRLHEEKLFLNPDFSREDLCKLADTNRMYISSSINKYAEMNINQWLNKARVNYAIRLIHEGETNLKVLAGASGFSSTTSFFRNFKQFTLLSPKQYIDRECPKTFKPSNVPITDFTKTENK